MGKLTIQEIAAILVEKNGFERRDANQFASVMFSLIQEKLEADQLVKIKGLGTFKIIDVEARESVSVRTGERVTINGHAKVSFTPDATMRELVNKPFSQFETVVLNEGVVFDDLKEEPEEDAPAEVEEPVLAVEDEKQVSAVEDEKQAPAVENEKQVPAVEDEESALVQPLMEVVDTEESAVMVETEETPAPSPEPEPAPSPESESVPSPEPSPEVDSQPSEDIVLDDEDEGRPWGRWLLGTLGVLALMALSAWGGYYYGSHQSPKVVAPDTIVIHDTIAVASVDTIPVVTDVEPTPEPPKTEPTKEPAKVAPVKEEPKPEAVDKYAQKDDRVRLGAYRIVGLDREVKVMAGQTFYSICRAHLGPDMECYVEVFNDLPRNPKVKEGQVIRIPKLQLKKRGK